jgi:TPR repeat protein
MWNIGSLHHLSMITHESKTKTLSRNNNDEKFSDEFQKILKQCEKGDKVSCDKASFTLYNTGDMPRVIVISERMCDLKYGSFCTELGNIYTDGIKGVAYDSQKGYSFYKLGCALGNTHACEGLKQFSLINGIIVHNTAPKIEKIAISCNNGDTTACIDLAVIYKDGIGVKKDTEQALELFHKGCNTQELSMDRRCEGAYDIIEARDSESTK